MKIEYIRDELDKLNSKMLSLSKSYSFALLENKSLDVQNYIQNCNKIYTNSSLLKYTEDIRYTDARKELLFFLNRKFDEMLNTRYSFLLDITTYIYNSVNDVQAYRKIRKSFKELDEGSIISYEEGIKLEKILNKIGGVNCGL